MKPQVAILTTDGINCDHETAYAFQKAGGVAQIVSLNQLKAKKNLLFEFQILAIPGGFSYGDDIASGKVFALELALFFKEQLEEFIARGNIIMGICNGFQVLVQLGLLPFATIGEKKVSLITNDSSHFECRWINLMIDKSPCIFTKGFEDAEIMLPVAHGEGKFFADAVMLQQLEEKKLTVLRYAFQEEATQQYPHNPNGSLHAIAGICDPTGKIFGLMPHPERAVEYYHMPQWRRTMQKPYGLLFFEQAITYMS